MAKKVIDTYTPKSINRPGVHAKTKHSNQKTSRLYKKKYRGQGR